MAFIANNRFPLARGRPFESCHCRLLPLLSILFYDLSVWTVFL
jgi:hypothetical protein